jgi:hypothetical protein
MKTDLTVGLKHFWSFDKRGQVGWRDFGSDGGLTHFEENEYLSVSEVTGKLGSAIKFDGSSSHFVEARDVETLRATSGILTFAFWFKLDRLDVIQTLLHKSGGFEGQIVPEYRIYVQRFIGPPVTHELRFEVLFPADPLEVILPVTDFLQAERWHFLIATSIPGTGLRIQLDDPQRGSSAVFTWAETPQTPFAWSPLRLGGDSITGPPLHGAIDELAIWNRELTYQETMRLWNKGKGLPFKQWGQPKDCRTVTCCQ